MSAVTGTRKTMHDKRVARTFLNRHGKSHPLLQTLPYLRESRFRIAALLVTVTASVGVSIVIAWYFQSLTEAAILHESARMKELTLIGFILLPLVCGIAYLEGYLRDATVNRLTNTLQVSLFEAILGMEMGRFAARSAGDVLSRLTRDVETLGRGLGSNLINLFRLPLITGASLVYLLIVDWKLTLLCMALIPAAILATLAIGRLARRNSREISAVLGDVYAFLNESLSGYLVVRVFGLQQHFKRSFEQQTDRLLQLRMKNTRLRSSATAAGSLVHYVAYLMSFTLGAYLVSHGTISIGELLAFTTLMQRMVGPLMSSSGDIGNFQMAMAAAERICDLLNEVHEGHDTYAPMRRQLTEGGVEFCNVSFCYGKDAYALRSFSIRVAPGATVALVGPSGGGKSTVFRLLLGLYSLDSGDILIGNKKIGQIPPEDWRSAISYVPQDPYLFSGSIRENIRFGRLDASDEDILAAARAAHVDEFARMLAEGYDTEVGEGGCLLSGGQRQRVTIARAFLKDAPVLLLDEATSALDSMSERHVQDALARLMSGRTTLFIAHRLATVLRADYVYVLEGGSVVQEGEPLALLARDGLFARLWQTEGHTIPLA